MEIIKTRTETFVIDPVHGIFILYHWPLIQIQIVCVFVWRYKYLLHYLALSFTILLNHYLRIFIHVLCLQYHWRDCISGDVQTQHRLLFLISQNKIKKEKKEIVFLFPICFVFVVSYIVHVCRYWASEWCVLWQLFVQLWI